MTLVEPPEPGARLKPTPVPESVTKCGLADELSVTVRVPLRAPTPAGEKVTEIAQLDAAATIEPQLFVYPKSPVMLIEPMATALLPLFVSVTFCPALIVPRTCEANVRLLGETMVSGPVPVPVSMIVWGDGDASSEMEIWPARLPAAVGVNTTEMEQFAPGATLAPQVLVWLKSPEAVMPEIFNGPVP